MKTTIEINGFTIKIEDLEGKVTITAEKEGDVIDEIVLNPEEESAEQEESTEGVKNFDEFEKGQSGESDKNTEESEEESEESEESDEEADELPEGEIKEGLMNFDKFLTKKTK